jgi:hypothetical protein
VVFVTDSSGKPVEGATACFGDDRWEFLLGPSGPDGFLEGIVAGHGRLSVFGPDRGSRAFVEGLGTESTVGKEVAVRLVPGVPITGRVVVPAREGVTPMKAHVRAELLEDKDWATVEWALAGEDGAFEFPSLPPGRYALTAFPRNESAGQWESDLEPTLAEAGARGVEVRLVRVASLHVQIVEAGEDPPEPGPVDVFLWDPGGALVAQRLGVLRFHGLVFRIAAGRKYRVTVECPGWRQEGTGELEIPPGAPEAEVTVPLRVDEDPGATLEIILHDERGEPVQRIGIGVKQDRWPQMTRPRSLGETGCRLALSPGNWCVKLAPDGARDSGEPWLTQVLDVDLGPGETLVREVTVVRGGWARFLYEDEDRAELVVIEGPECPELSMDGRYSLVPGGRCVLATGHWIVELRRRLADPVRRDFDLSAGESVEIDFR